MKLNVIFLAAAVLYGCATTQPAATSASAQEEEREQKRAADNAYAGALDKLAHDPQMIQYIADNICNTPQPQRAQLANELIRTHHIDVARAFDADNRPNLEGSGQVLTIQIPCPT